VRKVEGFSRETVIIAYREAWSGEKPGVDTRSCAVVNQQALAIVDAKQRAGSWQQILALIGASEGRDLGGDAEGHPMAGAQRARLPLDDWKDAGLKIESSKSDAGERVYRIVK
jgi:hypothetical protein